MRISRYLHVIVLTFVCQLNFTFGLAQTWQLKKDLQSKANELFLQLKPTIEEHLLILEREDDIHEFNLSNHRVRVYNFRLDSTYKISRSKLLIDDFLYLVEYGKIHTIYLVGSDFDRSENGPDIELLIMKHFVFRNDSSVAFLQDTISYNQDGSGLDCFSFTLINNEPAYQSAFLPRTQFPSEIFEFKDMKEFYLNFADTIVLSLKSRNGVFRNINVKFSSFYLNDTTLLNEEYIFTLDKKQRIKKLEKYNYISARPTYTNIRFRIPWKRRKVFIYNIKDRVHVFRALGLKIF
jgi:hypothetical protein